MDTDGTYLCAVDAIATIGSVLAAFTTDPLLVRSTFRCFRLDVAIPSAIGSAIVFLGVVGLLSAGLTGGQYAIGGVGRGAARHTFAKGDGNNALIDELRHGYRPEKDPTAFWFAIGGILYVAVGFLILVAGS